jgi:RNA polymerase sigma-70 factor (ECF subfamily)
MAFLHAQLDQLPEKYRLVLTLRFLQHLSYDEIATALDLPVGTVKTHIHRARKLLMEQSRQWEEQAVVDESDASALFGQTVPCIQQAGG